MAKVYTTKEALEIVMESDCGDGSSSSDSETDTEEASEFEPEQLESSSSSADSSEEGEQEPEVEAEGWASKNGKIVWSATNNQTLRYIPAARGLVPGPTHYAAARIRDPMTSFSLLLTAEIIQHILAVTNLHGRREITGWRDLDAEELQAYMGLIILAGVYRDICINEQLVPFKGRCRFRQYMPKKPAKYGLKIWATCDVKTSYAWRLQVYTGKEGGRPAEINQGMRVVLEMTEGLQGNVITCDNFFTSFGLSEELLRRKLALVGTIRRNKPELPRHLLQAKNQFFKQRKVFSSLFAFTTNHTLVSYIPRRGKNVLLLSTKHRDPHVSDDAKRKPTIIQDYNRCKGGVDNLDKVVGTYSCRRRTNRWPLALFHNLIDVSLYNAFVLWTSIEPSWEQQKAHSLVLPL
ncbi:hypothetical protein D5F01_LYC23722 [Larimichthys crocea]|uniref:PiggyBac transposable element-derived protein domain-containing protein n=1 Tax=Larimichthys crocea TaxID=215358 RepID=A0A6G0HG70_LARCR|nr:hypothetical protein D5F01_LYC23722 [Larimichthys crocea]